MKLKILLITYMTLVSGLDLAGAMKSSKKQCLPVVSSNLEHLIQQGTKLFQEQDNQEALRYFMKAYETSKNQNNPPARAISAYYLGIIHYKQAQQKEALKFFTEAYSAGKQNSDLNDLAADSADYLGKIYADGLVVDQDFDKAFSYLNEASGLIKHSVNQSVLNKIQNNRKFLLGLVWRQANEKSKSEQYQDAFELFEKVYENCKNDLEMYASVTQKLGELYALGLGVPKKDTKMALEYFTKAYKLSKQNSELHGQAAMRLAELYFVENPNMPRDYQKALEYLNESYRLGFNQDPVAGYLGYVYLLTGDVANAHKYYEVAYTFKSSREYPKVLANLGFIYLERDKDYQKAQRYFYEAYQLASGADKFTALYNLYAIQGFLLNKFDAMLKEIRNNPTETSIKQAKEVLDDAAAIKFIGLEFNNHIKEGYAKLDEARQQLQAQQECHTQAKPELISAVQQQKLDERDKKNKQEQVSNLLKQFDVLLEAYKKQQEVSSAQFEEAKRILLEASLNAIDLDTRLLLKEKFGDLASEHAQKQNNVRELLREIYQDVDRYTDDSFSRAQKNLYVAQTLSGDDMQLQSDIADANKNLQEKIQKKAQQMQPAVEGSDEEDEKELEQLVKCKDREGALRTVTAGEVEKVLLSLGFEKIPTSGGSHMKYNKSDKTVSVPFHAQEPLKKGTFQGILKQAGISSQEFNNRLDSI